MRDDIILGKMLHYAEKVCAYSAGLSYEDFRANDMLVEACVFNLGQIGESQRNWAWISRKSIRRWHGHRSMDCGIALSMTTRA